MSQEYTGAIAILIFSILQALGIVVEKDAIAGIITGIIVPVLGPGIVVGNAANTYPQPSYVLNKETINVKCYRNGYSKAARKKNIHGALRG